MVYDKVVGDKVVCQRGFVTKLCVKDWVKDGVSKKVCARVCERWCVTKLWVTKLCQRGCVTKLCE